MNELQMIRDGYGTKKFAPALDDHGVSDYLATHNLLRAHAKVYRLYDKVYRPNQKGTPKSFIYFTEDAKFNKW